jgi:hypothetical protein
MINFDITRNWTILTPFGLKAALLAAADLGRIVGLLRARAGLGAKEAPVRNSFAPIDASVPVIVLNSESDPGANGFSWRAGVDRIEIYGASERGLCDGVYDFLAAFGVNWPEPGVELLPEPHPDHPPEYSLKAGNAYRATVRAPDKRRRLVITGETPLSRRVDFLVWAVRNCIDALVLPLVEKPPSFAALTGKYRRVRENLFSLAKQYALPVEIGGWDLSLLVPRRHFPVKKDIFRMEWGKRTSKYNFCPTNPDTIALLKAEARRRFGDYPDVSVFHLWPDRNAEHSWCSCPNCRAFSREEQNRIAVNTAADILAEINAGAVLSYYENTGDPADNPVEVGVRLNMFRLPLLPGQEGAEKAGLFLAASGK